MSDMIRITAMPLDPETYTLECSECGPVGATSVEDIRQAIWNHYASHRDAYRAQQGAQS